MRLSDLADDATTHEDSADEGRRLHELLSWMQVQARKGLSRCPPDFTLQTTALVNEAVIRIMRNQTLQAPPSRAYLFCAAAQAIREALANAVRKRMMLRNGATFDRVNLFDTASSELDRTADLLDLHEAIEKLKQRAPRAATVVDLKFYAALTIAEIANMLQLSDYTIENDWRFARGFLKQYLS